MSCVQGSIKKIAGNFGYFLALLKDGTLTGWGNGRNIYPGLDIPSSIQLNVTGIAVGANHSLALLKDGRVTGWGAGSTNQMNGGPSAQEFGQVIIPVGIGNNATGISAGYNYSLALLKDGRVTGWGLNNHGQIDIPVGIGNNATGIAAGPYHCLALLKDGRVSGWGYNGFGQINIPIGIGNNATGIAAGSFHSIVLLKDGTTQSWGSNSHSQVGGSYTNVNRIFCGYDTSFYVLNDGTYISAGSNVYLPGPGQILDDRKKGNYIDDIIINPYSAYGSAFLNKDGIVRIQADSSDLNYLYLQSPLCQDISVILDPLPPSITVDEIISPSGTITIPFDDYYKPSPSYISSSSNAEIVVRSLIKGKTIGTASIRAFVPSSYLFPLTFSSPQYIQVLCNPNGLIFENLPTKTYGDLPFVLNAVSNCDLLISYTSSNTNVVTIAGNIATIVGAGTTTITASQSNSISTSQTLIVDKKNAIIDFPKIPVINKTRTILYNLNATSDNNQTPITYTSSDTNIATINGNVLVILNEGTCVITAKQNETSNYLESNSISRNLQVVTLRTPNILTVSNLPNGVYYDEVTQCIIGEITDQGNYHIKIYIQEGEEICEKTLILNVSDKNKKYIYGVNNPVNIGFIKYNPQDRINQQAIIQLYDNPKYGKMLIHSKFGIIYGYSKDIEQKIEAYNHPVYGYILRDSIGGIIYGYTGDLTNDPNFINSLYGL
jgi:hypothetical protein